MKVTRIRISNILGIEELEFTPGGAFTEISGGNGAGKTSVLEAIRAALRGGNDATLLRQGAKKGEVVLVLDDGTELYKRVTPAGTTVAVERAGAVLKKPATVIAELADLVSVNPVEFLRAPDKHRAEILLQSMPIDVDEQRLAGIMGRDLPALAHLHGLALLDAAHREVYEQRTGVNRSLKDKRAAADQMRATMPAAPTAEPPSDEALRARLDEIDTAHEQELARIDAKIGGLRDQVNGRIAELQRQIDAERHLLAGFESKAQASREAARADRTIAREGIEREIAGITAARDARRRYELAVGMVDTLTIEAAGLEAEAQACTATIERLGEYRAELLGSLPIPGLEVRDGAILRNGIPFDRLNTGQQVEIAVEISKLRAGPLGIICVDGLELLDEAHYAAFREHAEASGLQLVVSRVTEGPLAVAAA